MLVKTKKGVYKFSNFIYKVLQFTKSGTTTCAVIFPYKTDKWEEVDYTKRGNWHELDTKGIYSIDIDDLEIIPDCEIPENIKRDIKLNQLLNF